MASTDSISMIESRDMRDRDPGSLRIRSTYSEPSSFVVQLRQGAGVKEISWQLALVPLSADGVGKRPRNLGESLSGVIPRHRITGGCGPFFGCEVSGEVIIDHGRICDGHGDLLQLFKRQRFQRLQNPSLYTARSLFSICPQFSRFPGTTLLERSFLAKLEYAGAKLDGLRVDLV